MPVLTISALFLPKTHVANERAVRGTILNRSSLKMAEDIFAGCKYAPLWWDRVPRPQELSQTAVPQAVDVAVVGSGYTGLSAALVTARAGRHTVVFDAEDAGYGCSTRNAGQISTSIKPGYDKLSRRYGPQRAYDILKEGQNSLAWLGEFIQSEKMDCDFAVVGRFHAAHNKARFEAVARAVSNQPKGLEVDAYVVPKAEQHSELGTDAYFGGVVYTQHAAIDPARYHQELLDRARAAGAEVVARCPVTNIEKVAGGFRLSTPRGEVRARDVIVATNGYTGNLTPWFRRRLIPIGSYVIVTEPLPPELMARLIPKGRVVSDSRKVIYYYRPTPDRRRILFGGRVSLSETDPRVSGPKLVSEMTRIFPELSGKRITHSWCGFVAYTFDELMHVGQHDGLYYAMGYCGSGVAMASYCGMRIGQRLLGLKEARTAFDDLTFQTRPLYSGTPWFLAPSLMYYKLRDKLPI